MTTIQITRPKEWQNKIRKYNIYIDNEKAGEIANGETKDFLIGSGMHTIVAKIDWCSSPEIKLNINENEVQYIKVGSSKIMQWITLPALPLILINMFVRKNYGHDYLLYLAIPLFIAMIYMFTMGRKKYLTLQAF